MKKRTLTILLALLMLAANFAGCAESTEPGETDTPAVVPEETVAETEETSPYLDELPDVLKFDGADVNFYSRGHMRFDDEITVDEMSGDVVNDAIFNRELLVETRLDISLNNTREGTDPQGNASKMREMVLAGTDEYDLFTSSMCSVAPEMIQGIFLDMHTLPYLEPSKPYYTQDYVTNAQLGNALYTITGDISLSLIRYSFAMYFNKQLIEDYKLENPYTTVLEGRWTHDVMKSTIGNIYTDLNGDGKKTHEDFYGLGSTHVIIVDAYTAAYDVSMMGMSEDGYPQLMVDQEKMSAVMDKIYELNYKTEGVRIYYDTHDDNSMNDLLVPFSENRFVFINNWIYATETEYLRNMENDYGIIPYPKYDEHQAEYYTFQHDQIGVFGIPITTSIPDIAAATLEALSSESHVSVVPNYYDVALKGKYARDEETKKMIDIINNGHLMDPSWMYCWRIGELPQTLRNQMLAGQHNFASVYKQSEKIYARSLDRMIEDAMKLKEQ